MTWMLGLLAAGWMAQAAEGDAPAPVFPDKNLEKAARKYIFEKRDNDKPIVAADLANLSILLGPAAGLASLAGLEHAQGLAQLDIARNDVKDLSPLKAMPRLQFLNAAKNQLEDLTTVGTITALQYLELSANNIRDVRPLAGLTNISSLYLSTNLIEDISPLTNFPKISSLYLQKNRLKSIEGLGRLRSLNSLSLSDNDIKDLSGLRGLNNLFYLFLENNQIEDLGPLVEMCAADKEQRFAPFLNLFLKGNPLSEEARKTQIPKLKEIGVRVRD